jgi:hypothetical protein
MLQILFLSIIRHFHKIANVTFNFIMSICLSVYLHETTELLLNRFSWNLIFECLFKSIEKIQVSLKFDKNNY